MDQSSREGTRNETFLRVFAQAMACLSGTFRNTSESDVVERRLITLIYAGWLPQDKAPSGAVFSLRSGVQVDEELCP